MIWIIVIGAFLVMLLGAFILTQGGEVLGGTLVGLAGVVLVVIAIVLLLIPARAHAHDDGQWGNSDPAIRDWYQSLMMPDLPQTSCCGEADAYWADEVHVRDGKTFATVTDDRDDAPLNRPHVDIGTEIEIPNHKLKWDRGNPSGHSVAFLSRAGFVYCFVHGPLI
jgi:hypothetical protein